MFFSKISMSNLWILSSIIARILIPNYSWASYNNAYASFNGFAPYLQFKTHVRIASSLYKLWLVILFMQSQPINIIAHFLKQVQLPVLIIIIFHAFLACFKLILQVRNSYIHVNFQLLTYSKLLHKRNCLSIKYRYFIAF